MISRVNCAAHNNSSKPVPLRGAAHSGVKDMSNLLRALTLATFGLLPTTALACVEPKTPPFRQELAQAQHVFVFRLTSINLADPSPGSRKLSASIEVLRNLKGNGNGFRQLAYSAPGCYGLRLEVGHYYVAATTQKGPVLNLVRGDRSVMDISQDYSRTYPPRRDEQKLQWHVANYLKGIPLPATFLDEEYTARTSGISVPAPPEPRRAK